MSSYDPPSVLPVWTSIKPRPFVPLQPPPLETLHLPSLPSPPRQPAFSSLCTLSTHIIPAAYPRVGPDVPQPEKVLESVDKNERRNINVQVANELLRSRIKQSTGPNPGEGSKKILWNCINRYVRKGFSGEKGLTLFFAHANGFFKEVWEPILHHLFLHDSGPQIDEVWTWEAVQHGDSGLINKDNLPGMFDWMDNSRDILNFLVNYLPSTPTSSVLPTHLPRLPSAEAESRTLTGYSKRTLVAVGHSLGGTTSALVAINYPALFSSLILVDPIIMQPQMYGRNAVELNDLVIGAIQRREHWPSREEALRLFKLMPFFAAWDPEILKLYIEHGLTPDLHGGFRLKMSGIQEAIVFAESHVAYEVWELIENLDERIELMWIMPGETSPTIGGDAMARVRVWRRPKNSSNIRIANAGHLVPLEAPREFAEELESFIQRKYGTRDTKL